MQQDFYCHLDAAWVFRVKTWTFQTITGALCWSQGHHHVTTATTDSLLLFLLSTCQHCQHKAII
jgi:hypothetical protein